MVAGLAPRAIGRAVDPYDAYPSQFDATFEPRAIGEHARLLCPQLLAAPDRGDGVQSSRKAQIFARSSGHRSAGSSISQIRRPCEVGAVAGDPVHVACLFAFFRLARDPASPWMPPARPSSRGTLASAILIVAAFLVNRNIYNSDNYRYLIFLLTPWALGFGLTLSDLANRGLVGRLAAWLAAVLLIEMMTAATFLWYRDERGYVDPRGIPVRSPAPDWTELKVVPAVSRGTPAVAANFVLEPDVTHVMGGYWDVYKMAFLSGGRLVGIPYPIYPNRFRGWSRGLGPGRGKLMVLHPEVAVKKSPSDRESRNSGRGSFDRRRRPTGSRP